MKKKVIFLVSNDLCYDQRVQRHAKVVEEMGFDVMLLGRIKKTTDTTIAIPFPHKRMKLLVERSALFYACLNVRFFLFLLFARYDYIWANDLDTLPAGFLATRIRRKKLVYDSHEYFTGVPELENREMTRKFWAFLERWLLPKVATKITVNSSIAKLYKEAYGVHFDVVRNIGEQLVTSELQPLNLPNVDLTHPFIIYQGAVNKDRGLEELIAAMPLIDTLNLLIVGNGDVWQALKELIESKGLTHRVFLVGALSPSNLQRLTPKAFIGVSIEKPTNLNYTYCLPNKLFDYIHAEVPVVAFPNPEVKALIEHYELGTFIANHTPEELARVINALQADTLRHKRYKQNASLAKRTLNWETEAKHLSTLFKSVIER